MVTSDAHARSGAGREMGGSMKCYILVGGQSSRMGRPKAELLLGGETFLQRIVRACQPVFDEVVAVTRRHGEHAEGIRTIVEDEHEEEGPIFGIQRAMLDAQDDRLWVVAVDYPLLTDSLMTFLRDRFDQSEADLVVPMWGGRRQMLCAGYRTRLAHDIGERIGRGELRLQPLADAFPSIFLPENEMRAVAPLEPLWNVNRPDEYEAARRYYEQETTA